MYEKKYGDWLYYVGPDVPSNYPPIRFIASVDTKADPETEKSSRRVL